ncbi:hypothetical protein MYAM1_002976 [Malassezia yamatoensis]|uniref:PITH domain-containing protein n=1 Tax=Malassezia yamatoensis TaxID=253288 RepID=A0AAJ6CHF8_9BASI|nr:hypothetical protein MYAM1_002976 [Malassezia yamatoensis]
MSCSHEHSACGHAHDDADHVKPGEGQQNLLYASIDRDAISALNEQQQGSAREIVRPYDERMQTEHTLESDVDDDLIITIPFTGSVQIRALILRSGPGPTTPRAIHLFKNCEALDFDEAQQRTPTQKLESIPESNDVVEIPLLAARFPDVQLITLYIPGALRTRQGQDPKTSLSYLGFRGEARASHRSGPAQVVYEAAPRTSDHSVRGTTEAARYEHDT